MSILLYDVLGVRVYSDEPLYCILKRRESLDPKASVFSTECKECGKVEFFDRAKNSRLARRGSPKLGEFSRQIP